jgi:glycosyltransferase involved in cell wall biosynthesis
MDSSSERLTVLHYVGYNSDEGGIISAIRALALANFFDCKLGVNPNFLQRREPRLETVEFAGVAGERLNASTFWTARRIAREVERWLRADPRRRFHAHSRAGLAVAWWLSRDSLPRTAVSVHCLGKHRWFYRASARHFGRKLFWLNPSMRHYYGLEGSGWEHCIPSAVLPRASAPRRSRSPGDPVVFGGIGAFVPFKGWEVILAALSELEPALRQRVRFHHLGQADGTPQSAAYERSLRNHSLNTSQENILVWEGQQPSSEAFLRKIDCLIVPSHNEPLSLAMIEALQAGVPVLRADSGGAVDAIEVDRNGWVFRSGNAADLAKHLRHLLTTDALERTTFPPSAIERYSAVQVAGEWLNVYRQTNF